MPKRKIAETSMEAYKALHLNQVAEHHAKILAALSEIQRGSSEQISQHSTLSYWQVTKRMNELEKKNLIYNTKDKVPTTRGRSAFVYALVKPGETPKVNTEKVMPGESVSDFSKKLIQNK